MAPWHHRLALLLIVIAVTAIRVRLAAMPLERDEGEYAYAGQLILHGIPPYRSVYNMKFPGTYLAYAAILGTVGRLRGQTPASLHVGVAAVTAADMLLVYLLARRFAGRGASVLAAAVLGMLAMDPGTQGLAGHATHFVPLAALAGLVMLIPRPTGDPPAPVAVWRCGLAGVLLGISVLMKQPGVFFALFAYLWWTRQTLRGRAWRAAIADLMTGTAAYATGFAAPLLGCGFWLWHAGVFGKFWFWTIDYARAYGSEVSPAGAVDTLRAGLQKLLAGGGGVLWLAAVAGFAFAVVAGWRNPDRRRSLGFVTGLAIFSFAATSVGFYYRPHYFILMTPAAAMAIALAYDAFPAGSIVARRSRIAAAVALSMAFVWLDAPTLFRESPVEVVRLSYPSNPFVESPAVGDYLRAHTGPQDRIAVLGSEPQLLFYADRPSATGFIYTYPLMEDQPYAAQMQHDMAAEIEAARPRYVVRVATNLSWLRRSGSDGWIFTWATRFLNDYEPAPDAPGNAGSVLKIYRRRPDRRP